MVVVAAGSVAMTVFSGWCVAACVDELLVVAHFDLVAAEIVGKLIMSLCVCVCDGICRAEEI